MESPASRVGCLEPRQLRYVLLLVRLGSLRRVAAHLAIPIRALTTEIARVERTLGAPLFERQPRRTIPTAAGREIAAIAGHVLSGQLAEHQDETSDCTGLRVGWMDFGRGQAIQRAALAELQAQYPNIPIHLVPAHFRDQPQDVADGVLDVGFYNGARPDVTGCSVALVFPDSVGHVMLPSGHRLVSVEVLALSDLSGFPFHSLRVDRAPEIISALHDGFQRGGWHGRQTTGSTRPSEVITAVACGAGWSAAPSDLVGWAPPGIVLRPLADGPLLDVDLHVIWNHEDPVASAFVRLVYELRDVIDATAPRPAAPVDDLPVGYGPLLAQRFAERARLARELHDTLLQDVAGSELQLEALRRRLPPSLEAESREIQQVVARLQRAARSGREVLRNQHPADSGTRDLASMLSTLGEALSMDMGVEFRLTTCGARRTLRTSVEDSAFRVGAEALTNAFRHASATLVSVSLDYWDDLFRLRVSDDGGGIEPEVLSAGRRNGHLGLVLMQERAAAARATLTIQSEPSAGTVVEMVVPGHIAFAV